MYDLVIEGGTIVDVTGAASCIGSVYIQGDKIACIKKEVSDAQSAAVRLDAGVPWGAWHSFAEYLRCLDNTLAVTCQARQHPAYRYPSVQDQHSGRGKISIQRKENHGRVCS